MRNGFLKRCGTVLTGLFGVDCLKKQVEKFKSAAEIHLFFGFTPAYPTLPAPVLTVQNMKLKMTEAGYSYSIFRVGIYRNVLRPQRCIVAGCILPRTAGWIDKTPVF